ncbi:glutarate-semialdehyde dehydrogenase-like [Amphibalanus amphitrite]|uniref:glutarate-semialdehyde dehydrogenase-like n=1 Tax=Amphibalanus amphitrite TaxID=1232801 RepID=UPI001C90BEC2|nr:glutarate-semialdehyde dehydrogenase-like [Amphibalanus amphitrite]XP_043215103.1 glutarate-semialdehyde dehydrogenase-like [Amphibalanus amphitrite]XP_043215104.1 glutarate-semialdehyde dehydrogenase-like [Amphibalanus amphitrite]
MWMPLRYSKVFLCQHCRMLGGVRRLSLLRSQALVAGQWTGADNGATFEVTNPATDQVLGSVPDLGPAETGRAVEAAARYQTTWETTPAKRRSQLLHEYFRVLEAHSEQLAELITAEQGKPLAEARAEVAYGSAYIEWYAGEARRIYGDYVEGAPNKETLLIRQPAGVAALITPWNFPFAMLARKLGAALACGCVAVAKPAEDTPLTALAMAELAQRAGLPDGTLSVITSSRRNAAPVGAALCADPRIAVMSFTGSTAVGKLLYAQCAPTVKKLALELGGNSPFIVFDSADLQKAVAGCMASKFRNAGQTCVSTNRILVQNGIYERFVAALSEAMDRQLTLGNGATDGVNVGPLVNDAQMNKVSGLVSESVRQGAAVVRGGGPHSLGGRFFAPTLLRDVTPDMVCFKEEVFGPVSACARFETEEEALSIANNTDAGLAAYMFTENISQAWRVSKRLQYGMVGVNEGIVSQPEAAFGGVKQSGLGREGSRHSIEDYTDIKYICFGTQ